MKLMMMIHLSHYYPINVGVEQLYLWTVTDNNLKVVLRVARSDRHLMHVVHLTEIPHDGLRTREQFAHVAKEAVFPSHTQSQFLIKLLLLFWLLIN